MKLSRNKIAKLLKTGNQSRRRFRSKSLTNKDLILDVNTSRNNTSLTLPPAKTKAKTAAKTEKKHRQSMKKKRRGLNLRYKTLKRWWRQRGGKGIVFNDIDVNTISLFGSRLNELLQKWNIDQKNTMLINGNTKLSNEELLKITILSNLTPRDMYYTNSLEDIFNILVKLYNKIIEINQITTNSIPVYIISNLYAVLDIFKKKYEESDGKLNLNIPEDLVKYMNSKVFAGTVSNLTVDETSSSSSKESTTSSEEPASQSTTSEQIKTFIKSILNGSHCEFIDVAFVPHLTTYINSDAKYKKPYNSIPPTDETFMGFPYPQQPTTKATSTDIKKFEEGLFSAPPSGGGVMSGGLPLMKNPLEKLNDINTNLDKLNTKIGKYTTFFNSSLNDYSQSDFNLNEIFGGQNNLHKRQLLQKILREGKIVYEKNVILKTYGNDNTKIKRDVFDKDDYKFFNQLIGMQSDSWDTSVNKKSSLLTINQNLFDLLTRIATRMNDVDAGPDAGLAVTQKIVESIPQITLEKIKKKSFLGIIALFLSIYTGFNKCQEDFEEWKKNYNKFKDTIEIQKKYKEIEKTLAEYKKQFDEGTIGGISDIRTNTANEQMEKEITEAKQLTTEAIMSNTIDDPTTKLELIEKLKIKYYLQYLAYSFIMPNGNLEKEITKNQCINVLNKIKNIVAKNPITLPAGVAPVETAVTGETVSAAVEAPTSPAPVINDDSIDEMLQLFTQEPNNDLIDIAKKKKLTELLTPKGALYEAIYTLEANLNRLRAKTMTNESVQPTTTDIYEYVISQKELNNIYEHQRGGGDDIEVGYKKFMDEITDKIGKLQTSTDKATIENIDAKAALPEQLSGPEETRETSSRSIQESSEQPSAQSSAQSSALKSIRNASVRNKQISRNMDISPKLASTLSSAASASAATSEQAPGEIVGLTLKNEPSSDVILKLRAIPPQAWASTTYNTTEGNIRNLGADMMGSNDRDKTNVLLEILQTEQKLDEIEMKLKPTDPNFLVLTAKQLDAAAKDDINKQLEALKPMIEKFKEYLEALNIEKNKQGGGGQVGGKREKRPSFNNPPTDAEIDLLMEAINTDKNIKELFNNKTPSFNVVSDKLIEISIDYFNNKNNKNNTNKWTKNTTLPENTKLPIDFLKTIINDKTLADKIKNTNTPENLNIYMFAMAFKHTSFDTFYNNFIKSEDKSVANFTTKLSDWFKKIESTKDNPSFGSYWTVLAGGLSNPLKGENENLKQKIAQLQKELSTAIERITQLEGELATLNIQQTSKETEINQLKEAAAAAAEAAALAAAEIERLTAEKNKTETEHAAALQSLKEAKTKVDNELAELQSSTSTEKAADLQRLTEEKAGLEKKIEAENTRFETEKSNLQTQLTALQSNLKEKEAAAEKLKAENAAAIKKKEEELAKINQKMTELQSKIDAAKLKNTTSTAEMEDLQKKLEASQAALGTTKKDLETTRGQLGESQGLCARNDEEIKNLKQQLADQNKLLEKNQKELKEAEKKNFDSKMSIVKLLEYHIKRYEEFLTKINSTAPAVEGKSTTKSTTDPNDKSATLTGKSPTSNLGDGNAPSSTGKKEP